jgi:tRNA pseudouridine38-40 synthase
MPQRLKFIVAYDGTPFAGWQSQRSGNTIQDHLERAFASVAGEPVRVHGAGRTDAGVHALAQCAHVELPRRSLAANRWPAALNASLPQTIRVLRSSYAPATFHARFSAKGKVYRYRVWNDATLPPLELNRAWHVYTPVDLESLQTAAQIFVGRHDFASFAANRGKPGESTVRTIDAVRVRRTGRCIAIEVSGDGFLYKMVRLIIGALIRTATGRLELAELRQRLSSPAQTSSSMRFLAPAAGLFLVRVRY